MSLVASTLKMNRNLLIVCTMSSETLWATSFFFSSPKKTVISCRRLNTQQTFLRLRLQHKKVTEKKRCSPAMLYNTCPRVHLAFIYHSAHLKLRNNHDQRRSLNAFNISYTKWPFFKTFLTTQQNSNSFKPSSLVNARCVGVKRWR